MPFWQGWLTRNSTSPTATGTSGIYSLAMPTGTTASTTTSTWYVNQVTSQRTWSSLDAPTSIYWSDSQNTTTWQTALDQQSVSIMQAQMAAHQQQALNQAYNAQQTGLSHLYYRDIREAQAYERDRHGGVYAPAIITRDELDRRDQELYRRALGEHDDQEAARILLQIEEREIGEQARRRLLEAHQQEQLEARERAGAATARARELLLEHLSPAQRETFVANRWFIVEGGKSKTKYRINCNGGAAGNIEVLRMRGMAGVSHRLCCHARHDIPLGDQWLAQKVMLELAEDDFLQLANRHAA